jgi:hypothetical protein
MTEPKELDQIKAFVLGLIAGIKDTHSPDEADRHLEDYWNSWDSTTDINIWIDDSDPQKYITTLYRVVDGIRDEETFQRLDYFLE